VGLIKHVSFVEARWGGSSPVARRPWRRGRGPDWVNGFRCCPRDPEGLLTAMPMWPRGPTVDPRGDLDSAWPLPKAPWFEPNTSWTARPRCAARDRETAQHAGHATSFARTLDGAEDHGLYPFRTDAQALPANHIVSGADVVDGQLVWMVSVLAWVGGGPVAEWHGVFALPCFAPGCRCLVSFRS